MPYKTRTAPDLRSYPNRGGHITLCSECVETIRRAGPGTLYRQLSLHAPQPTTVQGCEHCGRRGEESR